MAADKRVKVEISAADRASQVFRGVGREADALKGRLSGLSGALGGLFSGVGAGALGAMGGGLAFSTAVSQASAFETALYETSKVTRRSLDDIKRQMLSLPSTLGSVTELTTGYYQVLSAGISDVAASQETLVTASKLAKVAGVSQAESIQALTKMMAGYRGELKSTAQAADLLLDIEEFGQASVRELVPIIGDLAGVSQMVSVQYKEMAAAMSLLTQTAGSPAQAATQYRALLMELIKPNEQMIKLIRSLGEESGKALVGKHGLAGALNLLSGAAQKGHSDLTRYIGSSEAILAVSALMTKNFRAFGQILAEVGSKSARTDSAFQDFLQTFRGVEQQAKATGENLLTVFGEGFLPVIKQNLSEFAAYLEENKAQVAGWGKSGAEAVTGVAKGIGQIMEIWGKIPDELEYGVVGAILFGKKGLLIGLAAQFVKDLNATGTAINYLASGKISQQEYDGIKSASDRYPLIAMADARERDALATQALSLRSSITRQMPVGLSISAAGPLSASSPPQLSAPSLEISSGYKSQFVLAVPELSLPAVPQMARASEMKLPSAYKGDSPGDKGGAAIQQWAEYSRQIDELNGVSAKADVSLEKALQGIVKTGKAAGRSSTEIAAMREAYAQAFESNSLRELNKQLLEAEGNTRALQDLENQGKIALFSAGLSEIKSLPQEDKDLLLGRFKVALAEQEDVQNLEVAVDFYQDLAALSGEYGQGVAQQNRLIDQQAKAWKQAGIPVEDIRKRVELMRLEISTDPFDGAYRGLLRFNAEFSDAGKQWESITYGFATGFDTATKDMFDDFLDTGRVSFDSLGDLFRQLLKDMAYQALIRPIVLNVVSGVSGSLFGATSVAGGALGGSSVGGGASGPGGLVQAGMGLARNYATSQLFSGVGDMFGGITDSINAGVARMFPSVFSPTAARTLVFNPYTAGTPGYAMSVASPTPTFTGMLGGGLMAGGLGSLGYGLLGGAIGLPQNQYTGITSGLGGGLGYMGGSALSTGLGATLGAFGSAVPVIGTILGTLAGGLLGGLLGGQKDDPPELVLNMSADLWRKLGDQSMHSYNNGIRYQDSNNAYWTTSEGYEGLDWGTESAAGNALGQAMRPILEQSWAIADALKGVNEDMAGQYLGALESMGTLHKRIQYEGEYITGDNIENWIRGFADQAQDRMVSALGAVDLQPLTVAADGLAADTMDELSKALADTFGFFDMGAVFEDEQVREKFQRQAARQITDAFADLDLSFLRLDFDQTSFAGLQQAYAAVQAWETVTAGLDAVINPASELSTALNAATTQFDGWIANLKALGWQEEAIAEIEQQRAVYLEQYRAAAVRASEQDLTLRTLALQLGADSDTYGLTALQYQQENELAQLARQYGTDSGIYATAVEIQQAELAQQRVDQLEAELQKALAAQAEALGESAREAERMRDVLADVVRALEDARQDIWASSDDNLLGSSYQESRAAFEAAYARGMAGDTDALRDLPSLAHALLASGRDSLATSRDYSDLFYEVDARLKQAQGFAAEEHDSQTAVVDKLDEQLTAMQAQTAVSEYTGRSVDAIRAELAAVKAVLEREKADVTAPGSLPQREALLQAKANQLNAEAYLGREDWTVQSTLNEIYRQGLSLESWYDTYGRHEGLGVEYDTAAARAAILANKTAQMNAGNTLAPGQQAGGWTGASVLDAIEQAGLSLDQWFLKYGVGEGISSTYKPAATSPDYWQLMLDKAAQLNAEGDPRRDWWTPDDVVAEIANQGMTVQQWYDLYGRQEGFALKAAGTTNKVVEKGLSTVDKGMHAQLAATGALGGIMDGVGSSVAGYMGAVQAGLGGLSSSIAGLDWSVTVNVTGDGGSSVSISTGGGSGGSASNPGVDTSDPFARLSSPTGIYGSYYKTETALLWAKVERLNRDKAFDTLPDGYTRWNVPALRQVIAHDGMTPESWYRRYGKAEGFASGGVTPALEPFWVGERGPELMMAPRQYGVLSNPDSMALLRGLAAAEAADWESQAYSAMPPAYDYAPPAVGYAPAPTSGADNAALLREIRELKGYLRQILTRTDAAAHAGGKLLGLHRLWDAEGLPPVQGQATA